ncbi:hypothetical protein, partial [Methylophaga pinxianii]|uniref:hypothetical protein n=1 Tax=Methylophaga pinxianii TaxID=2881052 RepID=UPI001CF2B012
LNSVLYFLLFDINTPFAHYQASLKCPQNRGRTRSRVSVGSSFVDPRTKAVLGIQKIDIDRFAIAQITLPNEKPISVTEAKPGQNWPFQIAGKKYTLLLESLDWTAQRFTAKVYETPNQ